MGNYCFYFRENGLSEICDLIEDLKDAKIGQLEVDNSDQEAKIGQLEVEKAEEKEKIPECPVNIKLYFLTFR